MKTIRGVTVHPYDAQVWGLLGAKKRVTRVSFRDASPPQQPDKTYRALLADVYLRAQSAAVMPERIKAVWSDDERAFILHGDGLNGFSISVQIANVRDADEDASQTSQEGREARETAGAP